MHAQSQLDTAGAAAIPTYESIQSALELEYIDVGLYRSIRLWKPSNGRGTFGGQVIAQAAWSATLALRREESDKGQNANEPSKGLHSLHAYFLSFGNADIPILYRVEKLRDGRSYSTRTVTATQNGTPIFSLTCSFALPERDQVKRQFSPPAWPLRPGGAADDSPNGEFKVPPPEECTSTEDRLQIILDTNGAKRPLSKQLRSYLQRAADERRQNSIEVRNVDKTELGGIVSNRSGDNPQQLLWFRSRGQVARDPAFQKCAIAYVSDLSFIGTAARAAGLGGRTVPALGMLASLDHTLYFCSDDIDISDWCLFYMECPVVGNGRGTVQGRIYTRPGELAVIVMQEGVVRAAL